MNSPYKRKLDESMDQDVVIHRADAPNLCGKVLTCEEDGCVIAQEGTGSRPDSVLKVFVAFSDIRGVGYEDWNYDNISG